MNKSMRRWGTGLLLAAALIPTGAGGQDANLSQDVVDATVRVEGLEGGRTGTGWVIEATNVNDRAGAAVVVTALNIIESSKTIKVSEPQHRDGLEASVLGIDIDRNLAFLEVKDIAAKAIPLARQAPKLGQIVFAAGFNPAADNAELASAATATAKRGSLSRVIRGPISTEASADVNQLEVDLTLLPGFEGGPILDACNRLIGIAMKSGGQVVSRAKMHITNGADINNGLKSDEVIAAAGKLRVNYQAVDGECGSSSVAPPTTSGAGAASGAATDEAIDEAGDSATETPGGMAYYTAWARENIVLVALLLLGLVAAIFGIVTLAKRKDPPAVQPTYTATEPNPPPLRNEPQTIRPQSQIAPQPLPATETGGTVAMGINSPTVREGELKLTGRSPNGEAIDVRIPRSAVSGKTATLGMGDTADYRIQDSRPDHKVSRMHAIVGYEGSHFYIEDNKSLNRTFLGGRALEPHTRTRLVDGDTLTLADIVLKVTVV